MSYLDNDRIHKPSTGAAQVYTLDLIQSLSKEQLVKKCHEDEWASWMGCTTFMLIALLNLFVMLKKDNTLRICLDPKDLN